MFSRILDSKITVCLTVPQYAEALFKLTDENRTMLRAWLPWLDAVREPADTRAFIVDQLSRFVESKALHITIFYEESMAGVYGFNNIDSQNGAGHIGYWLGSDFQGKGIMTACVKDLMHLGIDFFGLQRFEIRCAVENKKSRAIPERLGFANEGTIRRVEKVYDKYYDHVVYGKIVAGQ